MSWMFCEPNPIALNTALAMCGAVQPVFRLPYVPLSRAQREKVSWRDAVTLNPAPCACAAAKASMSGCLSAKCWADRAAKAI